MVEPYLPRERRRWLTRPFSKFFNRSPQQTWSIDTRQSQATVVFEKQKPHNPSFSFYPLPILPPGLGSIPRCHEQNP